MTVYPVYLDAQPGWLQGQNGLSLLRMPAGGASLLALLHAETTRFASGEPHVLPRFTPDEGYAGFLRREAGQTIPYVALVHRLDELLDRCEPADWLLLVEATCPASGRLPLAALHAALADPRRTTHVVSMRPGNTTQERVALDAAGRVRRIERYYAGVTSMSVGAVTCTLMSGVVVRAIADLPPAPLAHLRQVLAERGVPGVDLLRTESVFDLTRERGLLEMNERLLREDAGRRAAEPTAVGFRAPERAAGRMVARTATLHGPVIVHPGVNVEAHAVVIGPAVLGAGCRIGRHAVVAQCVVAPGATLPAHGVARQRVLLPAATDPDAADSLERIHVAPTPPRSAYPRLKRAVDAAIAAAALLVLAPLLVLVALLVKLTSRGPALYGDVREGRGGRVFRCLKFRTMVAGADRQQRRLYGTNQLDGPQFKLKRDNRVTPLGRLLRAANLDELPQLLNVLRGQMSLIGPRPSPFRENQICVPWRQARLSVRPGITGLWQMCRADRSTGDFHQWIYYDMLYVRHLSPGLDLRILLATLLTMGGHWPVPLHWLVPAHRLHAAPDMPVPTRTPILDVPTPLLDTAARPVCQPN